MTIGRADVTEVLQRLAECDAARRARTPGLHADRVNVIVPGLAILLGCLDALGADRVIVSAGLPVGIAREDGPGVGDPRVTVMAIDPDNGYRYVELRGRARLLDDGGDEGIDALSMKAASTRAASGRPGPTCGQ